MKKLLAALIVSLVTIAFSAPAFAVLDNLPSGKQRYFVEAGGLTTGVGLKVNNVIDFSQTNSGGFAGVGLEGKRNALLYGAALDLGGMTTTIPGVFDSGNLNNSSSFFLNAQVKGAVQLNSWSKIGGSLDYMFVEGTSAEKIAGPVIERLTTGELHRIKLSAPTVQVEFGKLALYGGLAAEWNDMSAVQLQVYGSGFDLTAKVPTYVHNGFGPQGGVTYDFTKNITAGFQGTYMNHETTLAGQLTFSGL